MKICQPKNFHGVSMCRPHFLVHWIQRKKLAYRTREIIDESKRGVVERCVDGKMKNCLNRGSLSRSPLSGKVQAPIFHGINRRRPDTAAPTPLKNSLALTISAGKRPDIRYNRENSIKNCRMEFRCCVTILDKRGD